MHSLLIIEKETTKRGPTRESNSGPLVPETRIIPLDHGAAIKLGKPSLFEDYVISSHLYFFSFQ